MYILPGERDVVDQLHRAWAESNAKSGRLHFPADMALGSPEVE